MAAQAAPPAEMAGSDLDFDWDGAVVGLSVDRWTLHGGIMDFLLRHGHKAAAEQFALESGRSPDGEACELVDERSQVRAAVAAGDISTALGIVDVQAPEVLGHDRSLRFRAHRQRVLDLLAAGREDEALACAERDLGEAASADPSRCEEVEAVMAAWVEADGGKGAAAAHRSDTADALNWALLGARGVSREDALSLALGAAEAARQALTEAGVAVPPDVPEGRDGAGEGEREGEGEAEDDYGGLTTPVVAVESPHTPQPRRRANTMPRGAQTEPRER